MYASYCNNHPLACKELEQIMDGDIQMESFFEGCRLLVDQQIPLEGFLLKPIQRICLYPLLLKELRKLTDEVGASPERGCRVESMGSLWVPRGASLVRGPPYGLTG